MIYQSNTPKLEEIDFCFENVEHASIKVRDIEDFQVAINQENKIITKAVFTLSKSNSDYFEGHCLFDGEEKKTIAERIMEYNDIAWIEFKFNNYATEQYPVIWEDDSTGCNNRLQSYSEQTEFITVSIGVSTDK